MSEQVKHYSLSGKDTWQTPPDLIEDITDKVGIFDLDPCAGEDTDIGSVNYRLEDGQDGLKLPWFGNVFVNPPFSLKKIDEEIDRDKVNLIVLLTPDATDTISWWHEYVAENSEYICFKESRLDYVDPDPDPDKENPGATFGTAMSLYGDVPEALLQYLSDWGHLVKTVNMDDTQ
jgi:hypothetical protein